MSIVLRRRAQALIIFVGFAVKPSTSESSQQGHVRHLVTALIVLSTLENGANVDAKVDEIAQAARSSMDRALRVMSVVDFASAVLSMIESGKERVSLYYTSCPLKLTYFQVQAGALELLSDRLSEVSTKMRCEIVPTIIKITEAIRDLLASKSMGSVASSAFRALQSIGITLCPGEESSLTDAIPLILAGIKGRTAASSALAALSPLP
jgi:U3 small nucleolar RNA-associated protein 10